MNNITIELVGCLTAAAGSKFFYDFKSSGSIYITEYLISGRLALQTNRGKGHSLLPLVKVTY